MSKKSSGLSTAEIFDDLIRATFSCTLVVIIILLSLIVSSITMKLSFFTSNDLIDNTSEKSSVTIWTSLLIYQITIIALIMFHLRTTSTEIVDFKSNSSRVRNSLYKNMYLLLITISITISFTSLISVLFPKQFQYDLHQFHKLLKDASLVPIFLAVAIGAPISEELLFRRYLFKNLSETRLGFSGAAIISTTGWTMLHSSYSSSGMVKIFFAGLMLSWLFHKTMKLFMPVIFHAVYNIISLTYLLFTQRLPSI
ncbi:MAG: hypothetical protein TECD_01244 [Hyphomicrobiaceae bacterium hypho_1]